MSMPFTCPHCGMTTDAANEQTGQTGLCMHCGKKPKRKHYSGVGCFLALMLFIIGIDVFGILISLLLPAVQAAREAAR